MRAVPSRIGHRRQAERGTGVGWSRFEAPVLLITELTAITMVKNSPWVVTSGFIIGAFELENYMWERDIYVRFESGIFHPFSLAAVLHCMQNEPCRSY